MNRNQIELLNLNQTVSGNHQAILSSVQRRRCGVWFTSQLLLKTNSFVLPLFHSPSLSYMLLKFAASARHGFPPSLPIKYSTARRAEPTTTLRCGQWLAPRFGLLLICKPKRTPASIPTPKHFPTHSELPL